MDIIKMIYKCEKPLLNILSATPQEKTELIDTLKSYYNDKTMPDDVKMVYHFLLLYVLHWIK